MTQLEAIFDLTQCDHTALVSARYAKVIPFPPQAPPRVIMASSAPLCVYHFGCHVMLRSGRMAQRKAWMQGRLRRATMIEVLLGLQGKNRIEVTEVVPYGAGVHCRPCRPGRITERYLRTYGRHVVVPESGLDEGEDDGVTP